MYIYVDIYIVESICTHASRRALILSIGLAIGACQRQWVNGSDRALWPDEWGAISMHTSRSILHVQSENEGENERMKERLFGLYKWIIRVEQANYVEHLCCGS